MTSKSGYSTTKTLSDPCSGRLNLSPDPFNSHSSFNLLLSASVSLRLIEAAVTDKGTS